MFPDNLSLGVFLLLAALLATSEGFFLKWGSDATRQPSSQKWVQPLSSVSPYRYQYAYNPYDTRKMYQYQGEGGLAPIPISVPAGAALTPVSLQHVQLVPCMCPVAPEEADKLDQLGPGPYVAQTYQPYPAPQQIPADSNKNNKQ